MKTFLDFIEQLNSLGVKLVSVKKLQRAAAIFENNREHGLDEEGMAQLGLLLDEIYREANRA